MQVGAGGDKGADGNNSGGDSYFISTSTVCGNGAANGHGGGSFTGDGGGSGGQGAGSNGGAGAGGVYRRWRELQ